MAELGLAIGAAVFTGGHLANKLTILYKSARESYKDANDVAVNLNLLESVLLKIGQVLRENGDVVDEDARSLIGKILEQFDRHFTRLELLLLPYLPDEKEPHHSKSVVKRVAWHFRKDDVRVINAQIETLKSTMQMMLSIFGLANRLATTNPAEEGDPVPPNLQRHLHLASQWIENQRFSMINLAFVEEETNINNSETNLMDNSTSGMGSSATAQFPRIAAWLQDVVGLSEQGSDPSSAPSSNSARSGLSLSTAQRSLIGLASNDVEMLLDKWTTLSETRSKSSGSIRASSVTDKTEDVETRSFGSASPTATARSDSSDDSVLLPPATSEPTNLENHTRMPTLEDLNIPESRSAHSPQVTRPARHVFIPVASETTDSSLESVVENVDTSLDEDSNTLDDDTRTIRGVHDETHSHLRNSPGAGGGDADTSQSHTYIEEWLHEQETPEDISGSYGAQDIPAVGAFSDVDLLDIVNSRAPSVISSISSLGSVSNPQRASKLLRMGNNLVRLNRYKEAISLYREAYGIKQAQRIEDEEVVELEFRIGMVLGEMHNFQGAERLLRKALQKATEDAVNKKLVLLAQQFLARALSRQRKWAEALDVYGELWEQKQNDLTDDGARASASEIALRVGLEYSTVTFELQRYSDAIPVLETVLRHSRRQRGDLDLKITIRASLLLATCYRKSGNLQEAKDALRLAQSRCKQADMATHSLTGDCNHELAMCAFAEKHYKTAERKARLAQDTRKTTYGERDARSLETRYCLASALYMQNQYEETQEILSEIRTSFVRHFGKAEKITLELHIRLADCFYRLGRKKEAQNILETAYAACRTESIDPLERTDESIQIMESLGPMMLEEIGGSEDGTEPKLSTEGLPDKQPRNLKLVRAADLYSDLYTVQKIRLGQDSEVTLQSGHDYGCLRSDLKQYDVAEPILVDTWMGRKRILGEKDALTISTGFQLGQVFFWENKRDEAINVLGSIHDLRLALFGLKSLQTIESAELLGYVMISGNPGQDQTSQAYQLLQSTFEARRQMFGLTHDTFAAAYKVATLAVTHGDLDKSRSLLKWIFSAGRKSLTERSPDVPRSTGGLTVLAGLSAGGLAYVQQDMKAGNRLLQRTVDLEARLVGKDYLKTPHLSYLQASLLFLQRDSRQCMSILGGIFDERKYSFGRKSRKTQSAGQTLAIALLTDSILSKTPISPEVDDINDLLFANRKTYLMDGSLVMAAFFTYAGFDQLAGPLFRWVYKSKKKLYGRFSRESLLTLGVVHGVKAWKLYRRAKGIPSRDGTSADPSNMLPKLWSATTKSLALRFTRLSERESTSWLLSTGLPQLFARSALWRSFKREIFIQTLSGSFLPTNSQPAGDFDAWTFGQPEQSADDAASRIWTVESDDGGEPLDIASFLEADDAKVNLQDAFNAHDDGNSSFGASLLELGGTTDDELELGEKEMETLKERLTSQLAGNTDLDSVRSNINEWEKEVDTD